LGDLLASLPGPSELAPSGDEPEHSLSKHQNHSKHDREGRNHRSGRGWNHIHKRQVHRIHSNRLISSIGPTSRSCEQPIRLIEWVDCHSPTPNFAGSPIAGRRVNGSGSRTNDPCRRDGRPDRASASERRIMYFVVAELISAGISFANCTCLENLCILMGGPLEPNIIFKTVSSRASETVVDMPVLIALRRHRARPTEIGFSPSPAGIPSPLRAYEWFKRLAERSSRREVGNDRR
jgi:hypothetical protein